MRSAVIVTTYNRADALDRVLASLAAQRIAPGELIVADDGSGAETSACIARWQARSAFPLRHVWQENKGFRAAAARNRAVALARCEYLIFLDGDCIVFADFVERHQQLAEPRHFVAGSRLLLDAKSTAAVLTDKTMPAAWPLRRWLGLRLTGRVNRLLPLLRLGDGPWRKRRPRQWRKVRTCNLGLWREDFVAINGFDEAFQGWGHEDADLAVRLIRAGVARKSGQFAVPVIHLWHREHPRALEGENYARLMTTLRGERDVVASQGVNQYLAVE